MKLISPHFILSELMLQLTAQQPQGPRTKAKGHTGERMKFDRLYAQEGISALDSHLYLRWWQHVIMQNAMSSPASLALSGDCTSHSPTLSPLQKEGRTTGWKMRSHSSRGHNALLKGQCRCARCSHTTAKALRSLCRGITQSYILKHLSRTQL